MRKPRKQLLAEVDPALAKQFQKRLIDDGISYRSWLEARIRNFLEETKNERKNQNQ